MKPVKKIKKYKGLPVDSYYVTEKDLKEWNPFNPKKETKDGV